MKIDNSLNNSNNTYFQKKENVTTQADRKAKGGVSNGMVYAGDLNLNTDPIMDKKSQAQKKALKLIIDQFKSDLDCDNSEANLNTKKAEIADDVQNATNEINKLEDSKQELKALYNVSEDSQEQKDTELLEKRILHPNDLTSDEWKQINNMGPLTDYQKDAVQLSNLQAEWQKQVNNGANSIQGINQSLASIELEKLKTHPMVDQQEAASKILEDASKEVVNSLVMEAKDKIDETMDENKDKVEKEQKEKEEQEKEDAAKKTDSSTTEDTSSSSSSTDNTNASADSTVAISPSDQQRLVDTVSRVADKLKMLDDDIKGIVVDEQA